jgi:glycerophosphoryl diester phosphodiesterase
MSGWCWAACLGASSLIGCSGGGDGGREDAAVAPCLRPLLFGHRGTTLHRPENTLPAFAWALEQGGDGIEVDVRLSADGEIAVIHDARTGGTTDDPDDRAVASLSLAELQALDAGAWFDPAYEGTRIPSLDEVAVAFPDALLLLDLKGAGIGPAIVAWIEANGSAERSLVSAFDEALLAEVHAALPAVPIVYYLDTMEEVARAPETGASYLRIPDDVQSEPAHMQTVIDAGYLPAVGGTYVQWNGSLGLVNSMKKTVERRDERRPRGCSD